MNKTIGVLGTGKIAAPMVRSLLRRFPDIRMHVSPRSVVTGAELQRQFSQVTVAPSNQDVVDASDVVLLCMMADVARTVLPKLRFRPDQQIVSVMIDYSVDDLLFDCHPVSEIELTMPLPFIDTGNCPLPCFPSAAIVGALYGDENPVTVVQSDRAMQPYIAVAGVVSGFLQSVASIAGWLAEQTHDQIAAEAHVSSLLSGYLQAIPKDGSDRLAMAMRDLSTEGGLNAQYRQALSDAGYFNELQRQLDVLLARLQKPSPPDTPKSSP